MNWFVCKASAIYVHKYALSSEERGLEQTFINYNVPMHLDVCKTIWTHVWHSTKIKISQNAGNVDICIVIPNEPAF